MHSTTAYTHKKFRDIYPDGIEHHFWNHARNVIIFDFLVKHDLHNETILEIGCGRGIVLQYLMQKKITCSGVDLAEVDPVAGVKDRIINRTDAFDLPLEFRKTVSSVFILDLIEHFKEPATFLRQLVEKFPNVNTVLVTVPARAELWSNFDVYNGHVIRYSPKDISNLAGKELHLVRAEYFNHLLYPVFWILSRLFKKRVTALRAPSGWKIALHRFISWILVADYHLLPARLPGTSIIALFSVQRP
jgi:2-polyprenyl-3-methyl-5-hydroxy-6-metoxy-1,4-benzoquinol methylase